MKNNIKRLLVLSFALSFVGCNNSTPTEVKTLTRYVQNGGFESSDLSGWTIEYGDAYNDDSVSSRDTFYFKDDDKHNLIDVNKTGNWYLSGQGFDLKHSHGRVGAIRSNNFYLDEDGVISMKLAGGAITKSKGENAEYKNEQEVCYVGVYLVETDQMIARQTNEYFLEHTESYVDATKYANGVYHTDNFSEYTIDLSAYANQECYIRIVDNDRDVYYGYLSVDDIRVGYTIPQTEGQYYVKTRHYQEDVEAKDEYHIKNPDFEIGSLGGWTIVSGDAFSNEGVNNESTWWNENITYNRDGNYHYGHYNASGVGVLRSSVFKLGGKGYISFKLGGCANQGLTYIRFMAVSTDNVTEIVKVSNVQYKNEQFPFVPMKMHLLNMIQYYIDLSEYIGENLYLEIVDNNNSSDELGCMTFDSFETYYESTPYWEDKEYYKIDIESSYEREPDSDYQVKNGTFETGDLTGWETSWTEDSQRMGEISSKSTWGWDNYTLPFNKKGSYFFSGETVEGNTGYITSSSFVVGGCGYMTFRMSGGRDPLACYVSIIDASTEEELLRFTNFMFNDLNLPLVGHGSNLMNMIAYKCDISSLLGKEVKIRVVDLATKDWGLVCVDSFITYYENETALESSLIYNPNTLAYQEQTSPYQVKNGTFETGDMTGWTVEGEQIMGISRDYTWWNECYLYNKGGSFFMNGWVSGEANKGSLTSSTFTLGGSGYITYKLGGGKNKELCHIEFIDADTGDVLATTYNQKFKEINKNYYYLGYPKDLAQDGVYAANMVDYKVDLSAHIGKNIKIRIVDNASNDWGLLFADEFVTYYESTSSIPAYCLSAETM
ncbi:MAG: hypothetical protein K6C32_01530 [Bacilli bacterium]|nr:hypothetical protein [Bacilli bacterium]